MSDRKNHSIRIFALVLCCFAALTMAGCSAVFTSTITGRVVEDKAGETDPVGVDDVAVYAFLNESQRNTAVSDFKTNGTLPNTSGSVYYAKTSTTNGEAGHYTISITWETTSSTFGKTADRRPVYLAYYHKDFGLVPANEVSYMTSDKVTTMVTETLERVNKEYTINLVVKDVAGAGDGATMTLPNNMKLIVKETTSEKVLYNAVPTGNSISFVYDKALTPIVTFELVLAGGTWRQTKADGSFITDAAELPSLELTDTSMSLAEKPLYLKNLQIAEQTVVGTFTGGTDEARNGHAVWLVKRGTESEPFVNPDPALIVADDTTKSTNPTPDTTVYGSFSLNIGEWTANEGEYPGRYMEKKYWVVISKEKGSSQIAAGDYYQAVTVSNNPSNQGFRNITVGTTNTIQ